MPASLLKGPERSRPLLSSVFCLMTWANTGCGAEVFFIEAPDVEGAQTFLFAIEYETQLEVHAVDGRSSTLNYAWAGGLLDAADTKLTRVAFAEPLEKLGWPEGPLAPSPAPNQRLEEVPFMRIDSASVSLSASSVRLEPGGESEAVRSFRLPSTLECPRFVDRALGGIAKQVDTVTPHASIAVTLGQEEIVVTREDQSLERIGLPSGEIGRAIAVSDRGRVWVATSTAIRVFNPERGGFEVSEILVSATSQAAGLFVREGAEALELWVLDGGGRVLRYDSTTGGFDFRYAVTPMRVRSTLLAQPARFAPTEDGGFAIVSRLMATVVTYRLGQPGAFTEGPFGASFGDILRRADGSLIVSEVHTGELWEHRGGTWTSVGKIAAEVMAIAPFENERVLFATRQGSLGLFEPRSTACPEQPPPRSGVPRALAALGTGFVFSGLTEDGGDVVGWLDIEGSN